ncbi:hypothetical protein F5Y10DRAFT_291393 [Nemania abortiva]|nr:hypothetical protein F5Y10DRAFT_291393 [Nemania abortiva]
MDSVDATTLGLGVVIALLGVIAVGLRFYMRYTKQAGFEWDDWLILASLLLALATDVLVVYCYTNAPTADSIDTIDDNDPSTANDVLLVLINKLNFVPTVTYFSITSTTKLSILLLYNRLFSVSEVFRQQIIFLFIVVTIYWLGSTIADILSCIPIKYYFDGATDLRYCFDYNAFWFATGISEAFIDLLILLLPLGVVSKLQLSIKKRVATGSVFLVGLLVIVSGLLKAVYGYNPNDRIPSFEQTRIWSTVHSGTGIICACLPVCWPIFASLGNFGERVWTHGIKAIERGHSSTSWSRLGTESPREESVLTGIGTPLETDVRIGRLSINPAAMEPFDVGI